MISSCPVLEQLMVSAVTRRITRYFIHLSLLPYHPLTVGGLLVSAVVIQRPDLIAAAVPDAGPYDMVRFQKFTLGGLAAAEFGSSDDPVQFNYLYKYSPLHNIYEDHGYPAILVATGDHDDRVFPAYSYKFVATS